MKDKVLILYLQQIEYKGDKLKKREEVRRLANSSY